MSSKDQPTGSIDIDFEKLDIKDDEEWMITSPTWTIPIETFIEDNCLTFEDKEENDFSHFKVHKEFIAICEDLLEKIIMEIGIDKLQFVKAVAVGMRNPEYAEYFEQLYYLDDFNIFKSWMVKKNAEMNYEAIKALESSGLKVSDGPENDSVDYLQKEKSDLDYAIAVSKQNDQDFKRMQTKEDEELQEALRLSELSFKMEQVRKSAVQHETAKDKMESKPEPSMKKPEEPKAEEPKKQEKINHPLFNQLEQERDIQKKLHEALPQKKTESAFSALPSLNTKGGLGFKKLPELDDLEKKRDQVAEELQKKRESEDKAMLEERKKKIMEQREKLQEQKRVEREAQLMKYEELKNEKEERSEIKVTDGEKQKRKQIYDLLRG